MSSENNETTNASVPDLITVTNDASGDEHQEDEVKARDVLMRARDEYAKYKTFKCHISAESTFGTSRPAATTLRSQYDLSWKDNKSFRIEGRRSAGVINLFGSNGVSNWELSDGGGFKTSTINSTEDFLTAWQGVTDGVSIMLPSVLLHADWSRQNFFLPRGDLLVAMASHARLGNDATVKDRACFTVNVKSPPGHFWLTRTTT